jgi:uncharacterized membrane protein
VDSTGYEILNFVHILAAAVWVGGGITLQVLAGRARRSADPVHLQGVMSGTSAVARFVFAPAALVLFVAGFGLIAEGDWEWDPWIHFGLGVWALTFLSSIAFLGPESGRIAALVESGGVAAPEVRERLGRYFMVAGIESTLLILVIADMVVKPGL